MIDSQEILLRLARLLTDSRKKRIVLMDRDFLNNLFRLATSGDSADSPPQPKKSPDTRFISVFGIILFSITTSDKAVLGSLSFLICPTKVL